MSQKTSFPDYPISNWTAVNSRKALGSDPAGLNLTNDRLATGNRRLAYPLSIGRGREPDYDDSIWDITILVPPYTRGIGLRARGVCGEDASAPNAAVEIYYRISGESWERFVTLTQTSHGSETGEDYPDVQYKFFASTDPAANPNSTDWDKTPIPVDVSDEPQSITLQLQIDPNGLDFKLYEYGFFMIPYYYTDFPDLP